MRFYAVNGTIELQIAQKVQQNIIAQRVRFLILDSKAIENCGIDKIFCKRLFERDIRQEMGEQMLGPFLVTFIMLSNPEFGLLPLLTVIIGIALPGKHAIMHGLNLQGKTYNMPRKIFPVDTLTFDTIGIFKIDVSSISNAKEFTGEGEAVECEYEQTSIAGSLHFMDGHFVKAIVQGFFLSLVTSALAEYFFGKGALPKATSLAFAFCSAFAAYVFSPSVRPKLGV